MIAFQIEKVGKFKLLMSRISKITSFANFILYNDKYGIKFDKGIVQDTNLSILNGCVPHSGISFSFSTVHLHNLLKNVRKGNTIVCTWDLNNELKIRHSIGITNKILKEMILKISVTPSDRDLLFDFDISMMNNDIFPGEVCVSQMIWILEKISTLFEQIELTFDRSKILIKCNNEFYSGVSEVSLNSPSNVNTTLSILTEKFLDLLWMVELISDIAYLFLNPKTLELTLAAKNDEDLIYIKL